MFRRLAYAISATLKDDRLRKIFGTFLLFIAAPYLLIAFISYMFTRASDMSVVKDTPWVNLLFSSDAEVENWLGKLGAVFAHLLVDSGFGIASILFAPLFFLAGFRYLFRISLLPVRKTTRRLLFLILWISVVAGYASPHHFQLHLMLGGAFGCQMNLWLTDLIGHVGTGLLLFFVMTCFLILSFKTSFNWFQPSLRPASPYETQTPLQQENIVELVPEISSEEDPSFTILKAEGDKAEAEESNSEKTSVDEHAIHASEAYNPTLDLPDYQMPGTELLDDRGNIEIEVDKNDLAAKKTRIEETLGYFNIGIQETTATVGPSVTLYEIVPVHGKRISQIKSLENDIAMSLAALGIRIIAPMPGRGTIGIEVPNKTPQIVSIRSILSSEKFTKSQMELPVGLGKTISNETYIADLTKMPHLLVAGATLQGKSVGLNAILLSLLYQKHPAELKLVMIDPKRVEMTLYNKLERHFLARLPDVEEAIIHDTKMAVNTLNSLCIEMESRYELLTDAHVRDVKSYNVKFRARRLNPNEGHHYLPYIVVVIDEFSDLTMSAGKEIEIPLTRLAQKSRAVGIHLIISTQRPTVNIITGTIKANFPARIAYRVTAGIDSKTILDTVGAERLVGKGDMLLSYGSDFLRLQCPFVDTAEVERVVEFISAQKGYPQSMLLPEYYSEEEASIESDTNGEHDSLFADAARIVVEHQQGSASLLQRRMKIGYNRAGRIIDQLAATGIIGPSEGSKARQVLITDLYSLEQFLSKPASGQSLSQ